MRRGALAVVVTGVLLGAALPAFAFVRETTTPRHPETGRCLWWRSRQVTYQLNFDPVAVGSTGCQTPANAQASAAAGFAAWTGAKRAGAAAACSDFSFANGGTTTVKAVGKDGVNLVVLRTKRCSDVVGVDPCSSTPGACAAKFNCWQDDYGFSTIGLTTTTFDTKTGEILDADMELFAWDGLQPVSGHYFTCATSGSPTCNSPPYGQLDCNWVDLAAVVTHEAGHMFGLDHVCDAQLPTPYDACPATASVMEPQVGQVVQRALGPDDIEGVCTLYPAGKATLTCAPAEAPKSGGCSSGGGAGIAALVVAALALRRRARIA